MENGFGNPASAAWNGIPPSLGGPVPALPADSGQWDFSRLFRQKILQNFNPLDSWFACGTCGAPARMRHMAPVAGLLNCCCQRCLQAHACREPERMFTNSAKEIRTGISPASYASVADTAGKSLRGGNPLGAVGDERRRKAANCALSSNCEFANK